MKATPNYPQPCSVEACDRLVGRHGARGLCQVHYKRSKASGDPGEAAIRTWDPTCVCAVDGCSRRAHAKSLCYTHYSRWRLTGDVGEAAIKPFVRRLNGTDPAGRGYATAHDRVREARGPAADWLCAHCGGRAAQWAYDHQDPNVLVGRNGGGSPRSYSTDPAHYIPLCIPCHRKLDKSMRPAP
jgi:hypothetical protein